MENWLRIPEAAKHAGISISTLRGWIAREGLRHSRVGGTILIKVAWLDSFLESHENTSPDKINPIVNSTLKDLEGL